MANALNCCLRGGRALTINKFRDANTLIFHRGEWSALVFTSNQVREMSTNEKQAVNSFALMRRLKGQNIPSHQAEAIAHVITEVSNNALQYSSTLFATKEQLETSEMIQTDNHTKFKYEFNSLKDNYISSVQCKIEEIKRHIQKTETEISHRIREDTMEHRLKLQHEKLAFHDELSKKVIEIHKNCHKLNIEFQNLNARLEGAKYDILKYCVGPVGTVFSILGGTIVILKLLQ